MVCIAAMLIFNASARGDASLRTNNPYAIIANRNVFGLQPSPRVNLPTPAPPAVPKITLTGITSILRSPAVLFIVTEQSLTGQVTGNKAYFLNEGETQDGIEVTRVRANVVFFNNHGAMQQISLGTKDNLSGTMSEGFHHPFD